MSLPTVELIGNVKRPELKYSVNGVAVHKFSLECSEKNKDGSYDNLYIEVVTFKESAEFVNKWFREGSVAIVTGKLITKVWEKDGKKNYDITLKFPTVSFAPKDKSGQEHPQKQAPTYHTENIPMDRPSSNQVPVIDIDDSDVPF